ncbi:MAG: UvrD-helicase domain-containing protein [Pseudomonadales bacterium]
MIPVDAHARELALDIKKSICVTAPAGSGKTELLTQRVLKLLAGAERPEQVLAVTFTRKAAAEMRERIVTALHLGNSEKVPDEAHKKYTWQLAQQALAADRQHNWQLLINPARLRIQTIDSLCQSIAKDQPILSRFGANPQPVDNAEPLYQQAIDSLLAELESSSDLSDDLASLFLYLDNNGEKLRALLSSLLANRDQWLSHVVNFSGDDNARQALMDSIETWIAQELMTLQAMLIPYASDMAGLLDFCAQQLKDLDPNNPVFGLLGINELPSCDVDGLEQWQIIARWLMTTSGTLRKSFTKAVGFPAPSTAREPELKALYSLRKGQVSDLMAQLSEVAGLEDRLKIVGELPLSYYQDAQWDILKPLTHVLLNAVGHMQLVFARTGQCDHAEITLAALRALGGELETSDVQLRWDYRLDHILVDEFQDTSLPQFELIKRLTASWAEDYHAQVENPRTLFVVGDGMQSIYAFRAAKVGLFLQARESGIGDLHLEDVQLSHNFRSQAAVVDWYNRVFVDAFPPRSDLLRGGVPYLHAHASDGEVVGHGVELLAAADQTDRQVEAQTVVDLIASRRAAGSQESIAILVRNRGHLRDILPALGRAKLAWKATDIDPLSQREAVVDLQSLTRVLINPADSVAWLAVLRAPWCGLRLADIHSIVETAGARLAALLLTGDLSTIVDISVEGSHSLQRTMTVLRAAWQERGRKDMRCWIEGCWQALGGPFTLQDSAQWQDVDSYLELVEVLAAEPDGLSLQKLSQGVDKLYAKPVDVEDAVQIMTIHKSKGLEFDTVILPGLDRSSRSPDKPLLYWHEQAFADGTKGLSLSALDTLNRSNPLYDFLHAENSRAQKLEATRLLYVACTRAKSSLFLIANIKSDAKKSCYAKPAANSLLAMIWDGVKDDVGIIAEANMEEPPLEKVIPALRRLAAGFEQRLAVPVSQTHEPVDAGEAEGSATESIHGGEVHVGTLVHEILELIAVEGLLNWDKQRIESLQPAWRLRLWQLGVKDNALDEAVKRVVQAISCTLDSDTGRWLLAEHVDAHNEWPLSKLGEWGVEHYIIDRSFVEDNKRWVIDYKTSSPAEGQAVESFLIQQVAQYSQQLANYTALASTQGEQRIQAALYFPLLGVMQMVSES